MWGRSRRKSVIGKIPSGKRKGEPVRSYRAEASETRRAGRGVREPWQERKSLNKKGETSGLGKRASLGRDRKDDDGSYSQFARL